jgi:hypothetical protein
MTHKIAALIHRSPFLVLAAVLFTANAVQARTRDTLDVNGARFKVEKFRFRGSGNARAVDVTLAGVKSVTVLSAGAIFKNVYLSVRKGTAGKVLYTLVDVTVGRVATSGTRATATLDYQGIAEQYIKNASSQRPPKGSQSAGNAAGSAANGAHGAESSPTSRPSNQPAPGNAPHSQD